MDPLVTNWRSQDKIFVISRKCYMRMISCAVLKQVLMLFLCLYQDNFVVKEFLSEFSSMWSLNCSLEGESLFST